MALEKDYQLKTGVVGNYWKITAVNVYRKDAVVVTISLYLNKARRELDGTAILFSREEEIPYPQDSNLSLNYCYTAVKALSTFNGAKDA